MGIDISTILAKSANIKLTAIHEVDKEVYDYGVKVYNVIKDEQKKLKEFLDVIDLDYKADDKLDVSEEFKEFKKSVKEKIKLSIKQTQTKYLEYICNHYKIDRTYKMNDHISKLNIKDCVDDAIFVLKKIVDVTSFDEAYRELLYKDVKGFNVEVKNKNVVFQFNTNWVDNGVMYYPHKLDSLIKYIHMDYPELPNFIEFYLKSNRYIKDNGTVTLENGKIEKLKLFMNNNFKLTFFDANEALKFSLNYNKDD